MGGLGGFWILGFGLAGVIGFECVVVFGGVLLSVCFGWWFWSWMLGFVVI